MYDKKNGKRTVKSSVEYSTGMIENGTGTVRFGMGTVRFGQWV